MHPRIPAFFAITALFLFGLVLNLSPADRELRVHLKFAPGLTYAGSWDPGYTGTGLGASLLFGFGALSLEGGLEGGYDATGFHLLVPVALGVRLIQVGPAPRTLSLHAGVVVMPGLKLNRPAPYFLFAVEPRFWMAWHFSDKHALFLSLGLRYSTSPDYSAKVGPYQYLDLPIGLGIQRRL